MAGQRRVISTRCYRISYILRAVAAIFLLLGVSSQIAAGVLFVIFLIESRIYFKFHVCFFALISLNIAVSMGWSDTLSLFARQPIAEQAQIKANIFGPWLVATTVCVMYFTTAIRKFYSKDFRNGSVLFESLKLVSQESNQRKYWDGYYPNWFLRHFVIPEPEWLVKKWRPLMHITIFLELMIPLLLFVSPLIGSAIGVMMHLAFTLVYPAILLHFSLGVCAAYTLFLSDSLVELTHVLQRI